MTIRICSIPEFGSWTGATGVNTIGAVLGYDLYNEAAVSFVDATGEGGPAELRGLVMSDALQTA